MVSDNILLQKSFSYFLLICFFVQQGAIDFHGYMIDMPTVQQARNVLRLAEATQDK